LAAASFILLELVIIVTGNYNFFNILTLLLCLFLFQDTEVKHFIPPNLREAILCRHRPGGKYANSCALLLAIFIFVCCASLLWTTALAKRPMEPFATLMTTASRFGLVSSYGPFAVMTRVRNEIIVEGSNDGVVWQAYKFKYKPDSVNKGLAWIIPHQPRLDWQMWFAAFYHQKPPRWFENFLIRLAQNSQPVTGLLANNPFADNAPLFLRTRLYRYRFNESETRKNLGQIWQRQHLGEYGNYGILATQRLQ